MTHLNDEFENEFEDVDGMPHFPPLDSPSNFITISAGIQHIYECQKEVGSAVFALHRLVHKIQTTLSTTTTTKEMEEGLADIMKTLEGVKVCTDTFAAHRERVEADWLRIQKASNLILREHGVDTTTLADESESSKRLGRWLSALQILGLGVVVTLASSWVLNNLSRTLVADHKQTGERLVEVVRELSEDNKKQREELKAHIERERNKSPR